jgi:hypothetical protein
MSISPTDPGLLFALTAGFAGALMLVQARTQARLLRRRIANGAGAVDAATGLWSSAATWQCIRAEANRALRLGRPLDVWVGTADDADQLDARGRELVFDLPAGAMGIRVDATRVCVLTCAGSGDLSGPVAAQLAWRSTSFEPDEETAGAALEFIARGDDDV